jgi:hypothetical protein
MGTRATIKFSDDEEVYFVYRGHDGFPDNVLSDITATLEKAKGRWSNPELGCLVTLFLAMGYDYEKHRLPFYDLTTSFHGDERYRYYVDWDGKEYKFGVIR